MYTHYHFRDSTDSHPNPFRTKSSWEPPLPVNPNLLSYIASVAQSIQHSEHTFNNTTQNHAPLNLNQEEVQFLSQYNCANQEYVIKPADKGDAEPSMEGSEEMLS